MKVNIQNSFIVRAGAFALALVFLFCSLAIPSFAVDSSFSYSIPVYTGSGTPSHDYVQSNGVVLWNTSSNSSRYGLASLDGISAFSSVDSGNNPIIVFVCYSESLSGKYVYHVSNSNNYNTTTTSLNRLSDQSSSDDYNIWVSQNYQIGSGSSANSVFPYFSSRADGIAAYKNYLINSGSLGASSPLSTSLPAGNAIIINITGNNAEALQLSSSSALRHKTPWSDGNQTMMYSDSAPSSISTPYGNVISWSGVGSPNLFGGYNTWSLSGPLNPSKNYLVIVNPAYPNDNPDSITSNQASNGPISISCSYCRGYTIVPLSSYWNNGTIANESGGLRLDGVYDEDTGTWTTVNSSTGLPQNPVSGGMTDIDAEHVTINDWLQNISHQIGSFFSGAIGAVSNLVAAGTSFINTLISLYSWLPAPVYSVLSSALILVITIGVIKVFI